MALFGYGWGCGSDELIDETVAGLGVAEGGSGEVGQEKCVGVLHGPGRPCGASAPREGGARVVGLQVGAGGEDLANWGSGVGLIAQLRAQESHQRRLGPVSDHLDVSVSVLTRVRN